MTDADREYRALFSHEEGPGANEFGTLSYEEHIAKKLEFTEKQRNTFLAAVHCIVMDEDAGRATAEAAAKTKQLDLRNNADLAWREYKMNLCELRFAGFRGGSGAASAATECEYRAYRQYVQQLAAAVSLKTLAQ